ncbi:2-dehydropantoate 2-reductase [Aquicoccus sp. G2-2]|uniref:2-dehydropantoate 2-reductase n=1 Tax=Aquicoccus sp. G2-2 TaxID=3092120 RepID=UPI002ADF5177|nr:2-dehydropantoate 2-reductase [Aquicoccus sp. G2-2]MEA1114058.1 2-dehydropantoate 2-reductase [Aquicoccus sp. G2-2]
MTEPRIVVAGAGAIGCFVGGLLAAAGRDVCLLGRARLMQEVAGRTLICSDFSGAHWHSTPETSDAPTVLAQADVVLVCVKSAATADMAQLIAAHAPDRAIVVSLQNGVRNAKTLATTLPGSDVRAGVVGFNVVARGQARFHRSTSGEVFIAAGPGNLEHLLGVPGLGVHVATDIDAVQWGKLVLNLTNAVNALSGLSLRDMLLQRRWRLVMAAQMTEALSVLKKAGIAVHVPAAAPGWALPWILRLPTRVFTKVAAPMLAVDGQARTSMVADLAAGRATEIAEFQGEILRQAKAAGFTAPVSAALIAAVRTQEAGQPWQGRPEDLRHA